MSDKRKKDTAEYLRVRLIYLNEHQKCEANLFDCKGPSTECHHLAGRIGKRLTDPDNFLAVCRPCHSYLELHPNLAKEMGLSLNRL